MINSALWVQWKESTSPSKYVIDGVLSDYSGSEKEKEVMQLLYQVSKYHSITKGSEVDGISSSFRYSSSVSLLLSSFFTKSNAYFCIEGNYLEEDVVGRKLVYIFITKEPEKEKQIQILKEYSDMLGVTLNPADIRAIQVSTNQKKNILLICIAIILLISLLLFMLPNHQSKPEVTNGNQPQKTSIQM